MISSVKVAEQNNEGIRLEVELILCKGSKCYITPDNNWIGLWEGYVRIEDICQPSEVPEAVDVLTDGLDRDEFYKDIDRYENQPYIKFVYIQGDNEVYGDTQVMPIADFVRYTSRYQVAY